MRSKHWSHFRHKGQSSKRCRNQESGPATRTSTEKHGDGCRKALQKQPKPKKNDKHLVQKTHPKHLRSTQCNEKRVSILNPYSLNNHHLQCHPVGAISALHAGGCKGKRHSHHKGQSLKRCRNQESGPSTRTARGKCGGGRRKAPLLKQQKRKKNDKHQVQKMHPKNLPSTQSNENGVCMLYPYSINNHDLQSDPLDAVSALHASGGAFFSSYDIGSASTSTRMPAPGYYPPALPSYYLQPWSPNYYQNQVGYDRQVPSIPLGAGQYSGLASSFAPFNTGLWRSAG